MFLVFACFAVLLTGGLFLYSRLSFERSFNHYMEEKEASRNARLINALEQHYSSNGDWRAFKINPYYWQLFVWQHTTSLRQRIERPIPFPFPLELNNRFDDENELDSRDRNSNFIRRNTQDARRQGWSRSSDTDEFLRHQPYRRFILLDREQNLLSGKKWRNESYFLNDLYVTIDGKRERIGYLGTPINPALRDLRDSEFAKRQQKHFLLMTIVGLFIALSCAIPLSYLLTQRVKKLARHVQGLSKGEYHQRLSTKGQDEIANLAENLNHLALTLNQTEQARKRWVADISHELRTPLAVLKADLEALEDGVRKFDGKAIVRLQKHAARLANLINDLYQLSLTDIGAMTYRKTTCDLREIIEETSVSLQDKLQQAGLELELQLPHMPLILFADPERLNQLFLNLFNNSINYTEAPGNIRVLLMSEQGKAIFIIEDSSPGVSPELHEKLFERLYRAESSRSRETGGAGLGLSICRNITEAHAGNISISSSELGGLKVSVYLPLQETL